MSEAAPQLPPMGSCGRIRYRMYDAGATLVRINLNRDEIVLPSQITALDGVNAPLTRVGSEAFYHTEAQSIDLPDTVMAIGARAFAQSKTLRRVSVPASVRVIDRTAFLGSDNVILQVEEGSYAHRYARVMGLSCTTGRLELAFDPSRSHVCGDWVYRLTLEGKAVLREYRGAQAELQIPAEVDGYPVVRVDNWCCDSNMHLQSVTVPDGVTSIGREAFSACAYLQSVSMTDSVSWLGVGAFANCIRLEQVWLSDAIRRLPAAVFARCRMLREIALPAALEQVEAAAFIDCSHLTSLTLPDGVEKIMSQAMAGCESLTCVILNEGLKYVSYTAFEGCESLWLPELPSTLDATSRRAFRRCLGAGEMDWSGDDEEDEADEA